MNPNQLGRSPFPASASQWMLVGLRGGVTPPPPGLNDGDPVGAWTDSSGSGNHLTQTGSARPTFKTSIVNSKPVVRFTSAASSGLNLTTPIYGGSPWTIFVVKKQATSGSLAWDLLSSSAGGPIGPVEYSDGNIYFSDRAQTGSAANPSPATFHVVSCVSSGGLHVNGTSVSVSFSAAVNSFNFNAVGGTSGGSVYSNADIAELLIYNVSVNVPTDIPNIEKYLGNKYGITVAGGSVVDPSTVSGLVGWWKADSLGT